MHRNSIIACGIIAAVILGVWGWLQFGQPALGEKRAKEYIASLLLDPQSAQFRYLKVRGSYVCGEVQGKNIFGTYLAFRPFWASTSGLSGDIEPDADFRGLSGPSYELKKMKVDGYRSMYQIACVQ